MGGSYSSWYDESKRKILILTFEDYYISAVSQALSKEEVKINAHIGFQKEEMQYQDYNLQLWFLTSKNRHLWTHHYLGTQGIILVFGFKDEIAGDSVLMEALNIFEHQNLLGIPVLVLFDMQNPDMTILNEKFRKKANQITTAFFNVQNINFAVDANEIKYGFDWLCSVMKPVVI